MVPNNAGYMLVLYVTAVQVIKRLDVIFASGLSFRPDVDNSGILSFEKYCMS